MLSSILKHLPSVHINMSNHYHIDEVNTNRI